MKKAGIHSGLESTAMIFPLPSSMSQIHYPYLLLISIDIIVIHAVIVILFIQNFWKKNPITLDIRPTVAMHLSDTFTVSLLGSWTTTLPSSFLMICAQHPAARANRAPAPSACSTELITVPIGNEPMAYVSPSKARTVINQSINQPINQSTEQSINQSINQSIYCVCTGFSGTWIWGAFFVH